MAGWAGSGMLPSEMTTTSARSRSGLAATNAKINSELLSSSPSYKNLTLAGQSSAASMLSTALRLATMWALLSTAPRATSLPSISVGVKGSVSQPSSSSAGWTS